MSVVARGGIDIHQERVKFAKKNSWPSARAKSRCRADIFPGVKNVPVDVFAHAQ